MQKALGTITGKAVKTGLKFRRNGGHTLPGLIVEKLFPTYLEKMLAQLPEGVVLITGTNGKTTTTKIVTEILEANDKKVLTNQTGSNLTRGIVSSIARQASAGGRLKQDLAVLEVDEAQIPSLVAQVKPRLVLALNVSRDQLDRFGEIDTVAAYVGAAMEQATNGVVANAGDPHLLALAKGLRIPVHYFGVSPRLKKFFPSDYELAAVDESASKTPNAPKIDVELTGFKDQKVTYKISGKTIEADLKLSGQHNFLNGAAALALCLQLLPDVAPQTLVEQLSKVSLAFGRGEKYRLKNGAVIELVLVKNPASFTQALASYGSERSNLMIAINDNIADGRDVSWLWDVNFAPLNGHAVYLTSGRRAVDMALRLSYDDIKTLNVEPSLLKSIKMLSQQDGKKVIFSTYTAMLQLYKVLSRQGQKVS